MKPFSNMPIGGNQYFHSVILNQLWWVLNLHIKQQMST
jgi:hypothetical protein